MSTRIALTHGQITYLEFCIAAVFKKHGIPHYKLLKGTYFGLAKRNNKDKSDECNRSVQFSNAGLLWVIGKLPSEMHNSTGTIALLLVLFAQRHQCPPLHLGFVSFS